MKIIRSISAAIAVIIAFSCVYTGLADNGITVEKFEYNYKTPAGWNTYGEIYQPWYQAGSRICIMVNSKKYEEKYALMDTEDGSLCLDNLDWIGSLSEYSELVWFNEDERIAVYDIENNIEVCELLNSYTLEYGGHSSEEGRFVTLASDEKLHFISNDGVIGNAVNIDQEQYVDGYNRLMTWGYLGEGLFRLGVGKGNGLSYTIGVVNTNGDVIAYVDSVDNFNSKGGAVVTISSKSGVINKNGDYIIPCEYKKITYSNSSYIGVKDDVYYEFDFSGNMKSSFTPDYSLYDGVSKYLGNGMAIVYNSASAYYDWKYGLVNEANEFILSLVYAEIGIGFDASAQLSPIYVRDEYLGEYTYGYINSDGEIEISFEYDYAGSFSEGLACIRKDEKYGFIDINGNIVIPLVYDNQPERFSEGLACIRKNEKYGFIDISGNIVIPFEYDRASSFSNGMAYVEKDSKGFYIDKSNEVVDNIGDTWKYSLTGNYNYANDYVIGESYTGGIRINATGQTVDISEMNLIPTIIGNSGECILAYSEDLTQVYRLILHGEMLPVATVSIEGISEIVSLEGSSARGIIAAALYDADGLKTVRKSEFTENIEFSFDDIQQGDYVKVMWWDSLKDIKPMCEAQTVTVE